jgi:hypothetical protein
MKFDVDFSPLELSAAQMKGTNAYINEIIKQKKSVAEALELMSHHTQANRGSIKHVENFTVFELFDGVVSIKTDNPLTTIVCPLTAEYSAHKDA